MAPGAGAKKHTERKCADTTGTVLVLLADQFQYTKAILSNSTRKMSQFEITEMLIAALKN